MPDTVNGLLPLLSESQEQKWSTINDAMERISALLGAGAVDRLSVPPGAPADGSVYLIGAGASGDWTGHSNELGLYINGGWVFFTPGTDFTIWVADEDRLYKFAGGAWTEALLALAYDDYTLASALGILPGSVGAPGLYINGDTNTGLYQPAGADSLGVTIGGTRKAQFDAEGLILGDDGPSANVTLGLVINQGGNDDGALALKSSDVGHAMTDLAEADTWFLARKVDGDDGGASLEAYSQGSFALRFRGVPTAAPAFNSSFSFGAVMFDAIESDGGTGSQAIGDGDVIAAFRNQFDTRAAIMGNGDFWVDGQLLPDDGAVGAPGYSFQSDRDTGLYLIGAGVLGFATAGAEGMRLSGGLLLINDTGNAFMTVGLTINQGAADNEAFALKSSDVAHGITDFFETDTYFAIQKQGGSTGGAFLRGISESNSGFWLDGLETVEDATKTTGSGVRATTMIMSWLKSGTGRTTHGANANLFMVKDGTAGKFIVDAEGDLHVDGSTALTAFDAYDDVALVEAWDQLRSPAQTVKDDFAEWALSEVGEHTLIEAGILGDTIANGGLVNVTQLQRLQNGAIRQLARDLRARDILIHALTARLDAIEARPNQEN